MTKLTAEKAEAFLAVLADGGSVTHAAGKLGMTRQAVYKARGLDPDFAAAWDDAVQAGADCLEDEAVKRAKNSSDLLLIFMLKAKRPDVYRERHSIEHSGAVDLRRLPREDLERELAELRAAQEGAGPSTGDRVAGAKGRVRGKPQ